MTDDGRRGRHWKWTVWPDESKTGRSVAACKDRARDMPRGAAYHVWQVESGSNGVEGKDGIHLQGHTYFRHPIGLRGVKERLCCNWVHLKRCTSAEETKNSIAYAKKVETRVEGPFEVGDEPAMQPGRRSDLSTVANLIKDGASLKRVAREFPDTYVRNYRGLAALQALLHPPVEREGVMVTVLWGSTGTGKTTRAWKKYPEAYGKRNGEWWDGYHGQKVIIWDEFDPGKWTSMDFCVMIDCFPQLVPVKGGFVKMDAEMFVFTSNQNPEGWVFKNGFANSEQLAAVARRLSNVVEVRGFNEVIVF